MTHTGRNVVYATLWQRFLALLVDLVVLSMFFFPVTRIVKGTWLMQPADHTWSYSWFVTDPLCVAFLITIFLYFVVLESLVGGTVGKLLLGIRVIGNDGNKIRLRQSLVRNILRIVDSLPAFNLLGVYLILTSPERTRFGDRIANSRVIVIH